MVTGVAGNIYNPVMAGYYPSSCMSQYMDCGSVFGFNPIMAGCAGTGVNYNAMVQNNNAYYDLMKINSNNMTNLQFVNNGNAFTLNVNNDVMQKGIVSMANAIRSGELGSAAKAYDRLYQALGGQYGEELGEHSDRVNSNAAIKATIAKYYENITGVSLAEDVMKNGEGYFANGFKQGFTLGGHHRNSAEETVSYMLGKNIENYGNKRLTKSIGKIAGGAVSVGALAGTGALIGSFFGGPIVGAVVGGALALGKWLLSSNKTHTVDKA